MYRTDYCTVDVLLLQCIVRVQYDLSFTVEPLCVPSKRYGMHDSKDSIHFATSVSMTKKMKSRLWIGYQVMKARDRCWFSFAQGGPTPCLVHSHFASPNKQASKAHSFGRATVLYSKDCNSNLVCFFGVATSKSNTNLRRCWFLLIRKDL